MSIEPNPNYQRLLFHNEDFITRKKMRIFCELLANYMVHDEEW